MEVKEIVDFLNEKKGYGKEGAKRLANKVLKGKASVQDCKIALKIFNGVNKIVDDESSYVDKVTKEDLDNLQGEDIPDYNIFTTTGKNTSITLGNTTNTVTLNDKQKLKLKSRWQGANGKWLESYHAVDEQSDSVLTVDNILDSVKKSLTGVEPIEIKDTGKGKFDLKVWTSDKHIGACTKDATHYNDRESGEDYSIRVFKRRMEKILEGILEQYNTYGRFKTITIADLGDATDGMDGYTARRDHGVPQNLSNIEVLETYLSVHKNFIDSLVKLDIADNIQFWLIGNSNHGGDFEYAVMRAFVEYLNTKYPDMEADLYDAFINDIEHEGITYILTHGKDKKNRKSGLPLYPDPKTSEFFTSYCLNRQIDLTGRVRIIKGDLHQSASCPMKYFEVYKNVGSIFGSSGWVMDNFEYTAPVCDFEVLNLNSGRIVEGKIEL